MDNLESNYLRPTPRGKIKLRPMQGTIARIVGSIRPYPFTAGLAASFFATMATVAVISLLSLIASFFVSDLAPRDQSFVIFGFTAIVLITAITSVLTAWNARAVAITAERPFFKLTENPRQFLAVNVLVAAIGSIGPLILTAAVFQYFSESRWNGTDDYVKTLYFLMFPSFFLTYAPFALAPTILAREGVSPIEALRRSLKLTTGNRIAIGLWLMFSHLIALASYLCFILPGFIFFHVNPGVFNNLYDALKEPETTPTPLQVSVAQPMETQNSVSA